MDFRKLNNWIYQPINNVSITLFRVVFSCVLLIQSYYFIYNDFIEKNLIKPLMIFPFIEGMNRPSDETLISLGYVMIIANIGMIINKTARLSTLVFLLCFSYFWMLDKGFYNNHYYFISIMCLLLFLLSKKSSFRETIYTPRISLLTLQSMVLIIYIISGINKLNPYWLIDLQPMQHIMEAKYKVTGNEVFAKKWFIVLTSYTGLIFDLIPFKGVTIE